MVVGEAILEHLQRSRCVVHELEQAQILFADHAVAQKQLADPVAGAHQIAAEILALSKLNWNRLLFFALGTFLGGWVLSFTSKLLRKV